MLLLVSLLSVTTPRVAFTCSTPIHPLECHLRSVLAETGGDSSGAVSWAVLLTELDPRSAYAPLRVALLYESFGEDSAALSWGQQALARDSLNSEAAMFVGRLRVLAGEPGLAAKALTPPLRQPGAMPELYALRAVSYQLNRDYGAALADLKRTGPLLPYFQGMATTILALALEEGRLEEAHSAFEFARTRTPDDAWTLSLGLSLAQRLGDAALERSVRRALDAGGNGRGQVVSRP